MLDRTDSALLTALNADGRASQRELAAATGVALGTVSNRLRRLHETGVLRSFLPDIDAEQAGFTLTAIMQLRIAKGQIIAVQAFVAEHPRSDLADNAMYWRGEAYYDQGHYSDALATFTAVIEQYAGGNKASDALLKVGLCYAQLGDLDNARDVLNRLIAAYRMGENPPEEG